MGKPRIAVHKFASCDGCQLAFLNMGPELLELANHVEIVHFVEAGMVAPDAEVDIAFVEGSVSTEEDIERILAIRKLSKPVITLGACAGSGGLQALRNLADGEQWLNELYPQPQYIQSLNNTHPVKDYIKVDFEVWGCPVSTEQVKQVVTSLLQGASPLQSKDKLCLECKRQQRVCTLVTAPITITTVTTGTSAELENRQTACLGPITAAGCGALCPSVGRACYGCYGLADNAESAALARRFEGLGLVSKAIAQKLLLFHSHEEALRQAAENTAETEEAANGQ